MRVKLEELGDSDVEWTIDLEQNERQSRSGRKHDLQNPLEVTTTLGNQGHEMQKKSTQHL